jgi:hypothetical protein
MRLGLWSGLSFYLEEDCLFIRHLSIWPIWDA